MWLSGKKRRSSNNGSSRWRDRGEEEWERRNVARRWWKGLEEEDIWKGKRALYQPRTIGETNAKRGPRGWGARFRDRGPSTWRSRHRLKVSTAGMERGRCEGETVKGPAKANGQTRDLRAVATPVASSLGVRQRPFARPYIPIILSKKSGPANRSLRSLQNVIGASSVRVKEPREPTAETWESNV